MPIKSPPQIIFTRSFFKSLILIAYPVIAVPIATAQEQKNESPPQTVEVLTSRGVVKKQDDTAGKITINRDEIVKYGDTSLSDVLKRQPSISVVGTEVRLRGLGNGYTQITINGDPVSLSFSLDSLAPESIERIEILRSSSAATSAQAIAGTINIVLRKSVSKGRRQIKLGLTHSAGHISPNLSIDLADKTSGFSYSLTGNVNRGHNEGNPITTETLRDANGALTLRQFHEHFAHDATRINLAPRLNWTLANGDQVTWQSLLLQNQLTLSSNIAEKTLQGQPSDYPINNGIVRGKIFGFKSDLSWAHRFNPDTKLDAKVGVNYNDRNKDQFFYGYTTQSNLPFIRNVIYDTIDKNLISTGKLLWHLNDQHNVALGWDGGLVHSTERRQQTDQTVSGISTALPREDFLAEIKRFALYAQDEWDIDKSLQLSLGLRWEGIRTSLSGNLVNDTVKNSSVFSPVLQALWTVPDTEKDQVRLALSRTYKAPGPRDLAPHRQVVNNNNSPSNPDYQGNPGLLPELATGIDLGYDHNLTGGGTVNFSGFVRHIKNVTTDKLFFNNGGWISTRANQGVARVYGVEVDAKLPLGRFLKDAPAIEFSLNAARNWSRLESVSGPDNRLADQTPITANFGIDYQRTQAHTMGINFNFQNGGRVKISESLSSYSGVTRTVDLFSTWKLSKATQLKVSLGNALHQSAVAEQIYQATEYSNRSTVTPSHPVFKLLIDHSL